MIELKDLSVQTKGFALKDISLTVQTGSCHVLIGPTGSGKTTLLEAILGLRKIQKGKILLDGKDITDMPVHERGFSYVPQDLAIFPHLSVEENIVYGIRYGTVSNKKDRYDEAIKMANLLGIAHLLKRKAVDLSGGERQRVALARALAPGHRYLLLDEPFSSLHEGMKKGLWFLLKELQKKYRLTILMVSHNIQEAFFLADFVSVMINGVIHQTDKKDLVYLYPLNLEVAKFFGIKNIFKAEIIGKENNYYKAYCRELNTEIMLPIYLFANSPDHPHIGSSITFGIRSEHIIILRPDLVMRRENLLTGIIKEIYTSGPVSTIIFEPDNSNALIEIVMPEFALSKLSPKPLMAATISLRPERLFVLR